MTTSAVVNGRWRLQHTWPVTSLALERGRWTESVEHARTLRVLRRCTDSGDVVPKVPGIEGQCHRRQ